MSSHHFVRQGQEPALLILDPVSFSLAADLLEWAPLVITTSKALETVLTWGIKVDAVFARPGNEHVTAMQLRDHQPVEVNICSDHLCIESCLQFLERQNNPDLHILAENALEVIGLLEKSTVCKRRVTISDDQARWVRTESVFEKWVPKHQAFVFVRGKAAVISANSVQLHDDRFVAEKEGLIRFSAGSPFWIGEVSN